MEKIILKGVNANFKKFVAKTRVLANSHIIKFGSDNTMSTVVGTPGGDIFKTWQIPLEKVCESFTKPDGDFYVGFFDVRVLTDKVLQFSGIDLEFGIDSRKLNDGRSVIRQITMTRPGFFLDVNTSDVGVLDATAKSGENNLLFTKVEETIQNSTDPFGFFSLSSDQFSNILKYGSLQTSMKSKNFFTFSCGSDGVLRVTDGAFEYEVSTGVNPFADFSIMKTAIARLCRETTDFTLVVRDTKNVVYAKSAETDTRCILSLLSLNQERQESQEQAFSFEDLLSIDNVLAGM